VIMPPGLGRHVHRLAPKMGAVATSRAAVVAESFNVPYSIVRYDPVSPTMEVRCDVPAMLLAQVRAAADYDAVPELSTR
jgi:hypothetical protein